MNRSLVLFSSVPGGTAQNFIPTESLSGVLVVSRYLSSLKRNLVTLAHCY